MRFGSLFNGLFANGRAVDATGKPVEPEAGMGATLLRFSDRQAGTIAEVKRFKSGKRAGQVSAIIWQRDTATPTDGRPGTNTYTYAPNPDAPRETFTVRPDGTFRKQGSTEGLALGRRDEHHDWTR